MANKFFPSVVSSRPLSRLPYGQARVDIMDDGSILLISYTTVVADISSDGFLTVNGLYSMTTRRHISLFVQEYCKPLDYYAAKAAYEGHYSVNFTTGEIREYE